MPLPVAHAQHRLFKGEGPFSSAPWGRSWSLGLSGCEHSIRALHCRSPASRRANSVTSASSRDESKLSFEVGVVSARSGIAPGNLRLA